jgi:UDPglucose--hexose-1-phosphate uridylyltransferase
MTSRRDPLTGDPVLFAPDRAARPRAFGGDTGERCPFCPGNESDTPAALVTLGDPWRIRTFPNKYPPAAGAEVIVESPRHEPFDRIEHATEVVAQYVARYRAHAEAAAVALFKNEGARAGSSIPHVHSQVVPLPFVPPRIARERDAFVNATTCPLCLVEGETIRESAHFRWLAPAASKMPYQQWIVPRRHIAEMSAFSTAEIEDLARLLAAASSAMRPLSESYNWMFLNFRGTPAAHAYVELFPRMTEIAGLELGTGTFVEIIDPGAAAGRLRS